MKKFYIVGPKNNDEGIYNLVTEDGQALASHFCSSIAFAKGDLEAHRPERQEKWKKKFGQYEVLHLGDDAMTLEELLERNKEFYKLQTITKEESYVHQS